MDDNEQIPMRDPLIEWRKFQERAEAERRREKVKRTLAERRESQAAQQSAQVRALEARLNEVLDMIAAVAQAASSGLDGLDRKLTELSHTITQSELDLRKSIAGLLERLADLSREPSPRATPTSLRAVN